VLKSLGADFGDCLLRQMMAEREGAAATWAVGQMQEASEWIDEQRSLVTNLAGREKGRGEEVMQGRDVTEVEEAESREEYGQSRRGRGGAEERGDKQGVTKEQEGKEGTGMVWTGDVRGAWVAVGALRGRLLQRLRVTGEAGGAVGDVEGLVRGAERIEERLAMIVAPVLACALLQLPVHSTQARCLLDYHSREERAHAALARLLDDHAKLSNLDAAAVLLCAEAAFFEALGVSTPHDAPTTLARSLAAHQKLRDLLDNALKSTRAAGESSHEHPSSEGQKEGNGGEAQGTSAQDMQGLVCTQAGADGAGLKGLFETLCVILREAEGRRRHVSGGDEGTDSGGIVMKDLESRRTSMEEQEGEELEGEGDGEGEGREVASKHEEVLSRLAKVEVHLCEMHRACSFEALSGMSFLQFLSLPHHLPQIEHLLHPSGPAGNTGDGNDLAACRLVQLVLLITECERGWQTDRRGGVKESLWNEDIISMLDNALVDKARLRRWRNVLLGHLGGGWGFNDFEYASMRKLVLAAKALVLSGAVEGEDGVQGVGEEQLDANALNSPHAARIFLPALCATCTDASADQARAQAVPRVGEARAQALSEIARAPFLADLRVWMEWDARFLPSLGVLGDFLTRHCRHSSMLEPSLGIQHADQEGTRLSASSWRPVEVSHGSFVKVPDMSHCLREVFNAAVPSDPLSAAAVAVSMVLTWGWGLRGGEQGILSRESFAISPLGPMAELIKKKLARVLDLREAAAFVFLACKSVPALLRAPLAVPLFVEPYLAAQCHEDGWGQEDDTSASCKEEAVVNLCVLAEDVAMVRQWGKATGCGSWMQLSVRPCLWPYIAAPNAKHHAVSGAYSLEAGSSGIAAHQSSVVGMLGTGEIARLGDSVLSLAYDSHFARAPGMPAQLAMGEEGGVGTLEEDEGSQMLADKLTGDTSGMVEQVGQGDKTSRNQQPRAKTVARMIDLDTAIHRAAMRHGSTGIEPEEELEIHPETLSVCESVRAKYGLNVAMESEEAQRAFENLHNVTNRSIQRLAADLYAKDVHFVLELLQNCDDCVFPSDVEPSLEMHLSSTRLEFCSNERGFETRDVLALCSVGESTKALRAGYV
jgi:hypothetical protein